MTGWDAMRFLCVGNLSSTTWYHDTVQCSSTLEALKNGRDKRGPPVSSQNQKSRSFREGRVLARPQSRRFCNDLKTQCAATAMRWPRTSCPDGNLHRQSEETRRESGNRLSCPSGIRVASVAHQESGSPQSPVGNQGRPVVNRGRPSRRPTNPARPGRCRGR